ncbi:MAG: hypothetical protein JOZ73_03945 [Solirubrobacterales bacterium]|nr:hypothetical protein [Solirubrobacterales bacterium]
MLTPHRLIAAVLPVLVLSAIGCGSSKSTTTQAPAATAPTSTAPAATTKTPAAAAKTRAGGSGLSGTWNGKYSGAYTGTFKLVWRQSGSSLRGRIKLSSPPSNLGINGSVTGGAIKFGTVGGGVLYSGSVSGSSMSGTYQSPRGGGSWSATRR